MSWGDAVLKIHQANPDNEGVIGDLSGLDAGEAKVVQGDGQTRPVSRTPRTIVLIDERPAYLWNGYYAGMHWDKRRKEARRVHALVRSAIDPEWGMFDVTVDIFVVIFFDKSPGDASNIPAKLYEDGLIGYLIEDDSWRHVYQMTTRTEVDKHRPRVEIHIRPAAINRLGGGADGER